MSPALLFTLLSSGGAKKYIAAVLVAMVVTLSLPFIAVASMGSDVLTFLSGEPNAESAESQGFYMGGPVPGDTYVWGNCTYWAFAERLWANKPVPTDWGNADTWDDNARAENYVVDHTPSVTAVFQTDDGEWGHVAYVIDVKPDGTWTISEMNAPHLNVVDTRTFPPSAAAYYTFIHDKKGAQ